MQVVSSPAAGQEKSTVFHCSKNWVYCIDIAGLSSRSRRVNNSESADHPLRAWHRPAGSVFFTVIRCLADLRNRGNDPILYLEHRRCFLAAASSANRSSTSACSGGVTRHPHRTELLAGLRELAHKSSILAFTVHESRKTTTNLAHFIPPHSW